MSRPTPDTFNPHWLARDPRSNRLVLGAELSGEEGFYLLRFDERAGTLSFDRAFTRDGQPGYLSLKDQPWPPGPSGPAWGHAALFLPQWRGGLISHTYSVRKIISLTDLARGAIMRNMGCGGCGSRVVIRHIGAGLRTG